MITRRLPVFGLGGMDRERRQLVVSDLYSEAIASIDRLHGAICELADIGKLGHDEAALCEAVFNRAQELCGHEEFRR